MALVAWVVWILPSLVAQGVCHGIAVAFGSKTPMPHKKFDEILRNAPGYFDPDED